MRLALSLPNEPNEMWKLGQQMGVTHAITSFPKGNPNAPVRPQYLDFLRLRTRFEDAGYTVAGIEGNLPALEKVQLGRPERDEVIEQIAETLDNMGSAGIPLWCYNWMAAFNWLRTSITTRGRGDALVMSYDHSLMENAPLTAVGFVAEEQLWDSLRYFLERIVPVAERAKVKLAIHPDDPPLSPIRGVSRIMRNPEAFQRVIDLVPSSSNGITFCQGCFTEMGVDVPDQIRHFAGQGKLFFVHFRTVRGTASRFVELFHDQGGATMCEAMRTYVEVGFDGPMRPDHAPRMEGDPLEPATTTTRGRIFAIGYMKGLLEAVTATR